MKNTLYFFSIVLVFLNSHQTFSQEFRSLNDSLINDFKLRAYSVKQSDGDTATQLLLQGLALAKKEKHLVDTGYFYRQLVAQKGVNAKLDSAHYWVNQGLAYYKTVEDKSTETTLDAHLYSELAEAYRRNDDVEKALEYYKKTEKIYKSRDAGMGVLISNLNLGNIHYAKSEYPQALERYLRAKPYADTTQYLYIKGGNYNSLSAVYEALGDTASSMLFAKKFVDAILPDKDPTYKAHAYMTLGKKFINLKQYKIAIEKLDSASIYVEEGNLVGLRKNLTTQRAETLLALNKPNEAQEILEKNQGLIEDYKTNTEDNFNYKFQLGKAYIALGENKKALSLLLSLKAQADTLKFTNEQSYIAAALSELYFKKGDYKNAYLLKKEASILQDSILGIEKQTSFKEIDTKYKTAEKEKDLAETRANLAEKEIEVTKKNTWIYGGFGLALILGLLGYLVYNQQKLKNNQLKKEGELKTALARIETQNKLQEQRLRISRDLHDNIGAQLTFIISSIDNLKFGMNEKTGLVANKLSSISAFTTTTIYELRDTIWAMNKNEITLDDLRSRISNFIEKAGDASGNTSFSFEVSNSVDKNLIFTSLQGMNIYRIIQEAVNNAIKYAEANAISVKIEHLNSKNLQVVIEDNGKGFNISEVTLSNGINNMKKRAKDLNATIHINSEMNKGTTIDVVLP